MRRGRGVPYRGVQTCLEQGKIKDNLLTFNVTLNLNRWTICSSHFFILNLKRETSKVYECRGMSVEVFFQSIVLTFLSYMYRTYLMYIVTRGEWVGSHTMKGHAQFSWYLSLDIEVLHCLFLSRFYWKLHIFGYFKS